MYAVWFYYICGLQIQNTIKGNAETYNFIWLEGLEFKFHQGWLNLEARPLVVFVSKQSIMPRTGPHKDSCTNISVCVMVCMGGCEMLEWMNEGMCSSVFMCVQVCKCCMR